MDDQEQRERRRALTDGWSHVLDGAAGLVADALAVAVGAEAAVRHQDRIETLRTVGVPSRVGFLARALDEIQLTRAEMELNPTLDLAVEGLLARIAAARRGESHALVGHGAPSVVDAGPSPPRESVVNPLLERDQKPQ